ncbi:MAG: 4-alpha-glucanotransferase [Candidatus Dormibacteraeota bacterium]|nr:4-alpha-glucanotransferase [Candidatus Dormibacteraeota bacterium]
MQPDTALASAWGIAPGYHDISGRWVEPEAESVSRVLATLGAGGPEPPASPVRFVEQGTSPELEEPHEVVTEDGATITVGDRLRADLPPGYHFLRRLSDGSSRRLVVTPRRCYFPEELRTWGWAVQLYGLRSRSSWGFGDLADLRELAGWSAGLGAGILLLNPLHAALPPPLQEPSPYYPSSRRFRNPLYIRVEEVPGAERLGDGLAPMATAGHQLNSSRVLDRDRVLELKMAALEKVFSPFAGDVAFDRYREREGQGLEDYATFCTIFESLREPWTAWPEDLRHPANPGVARFRQAHRARVHFHEWLQWLLDVQLQAAARELGLVHDLAIGVAPYGADTWLWQDQFAHDMRVGAPPDPFNAAGQDWGLPPFDPWRLRAASYEPFIQTIRAAFRHGAGLRIDHVMGLFRLFWIPAGEGPGRGVYVQYPFGDLLDILALESWRARSFVIGEDLGTVEDRVREEMAARRIIAYHLLWFEDRPPETYRLDSMAALTTHDLPTLAGVWEGADSDPAVRERLKRFTGAGDDTATELVAESAHRVLASAPSRLVTATLEDALGVAERPNRPGTTTEWPNWSLALPVPLEELKSDPRAARLAEALRR